VAKAVEPEARLTRMPLPVVVVRGRFDVVVATVTPEVAAQPVAVELAAVR